MRKVFLDNIPTKKGLGANSNKDIFDWKNATNKLVSFIYDDIKGEIKIISYDSKKCYLTVEFNQERFSINAGMFKKGEISRIIGKKTRKFKVEIGQSFKDENRDLVITDRKYIKAKTGENRKYYKYKCNKCGWIEGWILEGNLLSMKRGCSCCHGKTIVLGINTIWDTDRWMCDLGVSEEDAKKYLKSSRSKIEVKCPDCGKYKSISIGQIYRLKTISCNCGDGISYPEKFLGSVLRQLKIEFVEQLTNTYFDWCGKYKYDFYIPKYNAIIEVHGAQHYEESGLTRTLKEEQKNDKIKEELAKANKIDWYIIIDCRKSELNWIKQQIMSSELQYLFDLSKIDWEECGRYALSNLVKMVCDYWEKNPHSTSREMGQLFSKSVSCIRAYLRKGVEIGWCSKSYKRKDCIKVEVYKNDKFFKSYETLRQLERESYEQFGFIVHNSVLSRIKKGELNPDYYNGLRFCFNKE